MMSPEDDDSQNALFYNSTDPMESLALESSPDMPLADTNHTGVVPGPLPLDESHPLASPKKDSFDSNVIESFAKSSNVSPVSNAREDLLVEPPSYADVIFSPYVGDAASNGSSRESRNGVPLSSSTSAFPNHLTITVSEPLKVQDNASSSLVPGSNYFVTYLVVTGTNIPEYGGNDFTVRRRFRDVVSLADRLADSYKGYFIPCRPDKSIVESQVMKKDEFIEQRRSAIEKYLGRLASHPIIRRSNELRLFLQSEGQLSLTSVTDMASSLPRQFFGEGSTMIIPQDGSQPAKGGRDFVRMFKELRQSVTNDWGGVKPAISEDDKQFMEKKDILLDLERELSEASQQAEALVKAQQEVGETMGELGLAFIKIAKFETEEAVSNAQRTHAADAKQIATAAVKASRFYREANAQSVKHLDQLHEHLSLMQSVHAAFNCRSNALLTVQTLMTELSSMNTRIEKLTAASSKIFGGDKGRNRKVEDLRDAIKVSEEGRDNALEEYERIKEHNRSEMERFDCERKRDFLGMLKGFVHSQLGYAEKIANVWSQVAEEYTQNERPGGSTILSSPVSM